MQRIGTQHDQQIDIEKIKKQFLGTGLPAVDHEIPNKTVTCVQVIYFLFYLN